jgi:hypothetical protein
MVMLEVIKVGLEQNLDPVSVMLLSPIQTRQVYNLTNSLLKTK